MHESVWGFVRGVTKDCCPQGKVLEVGSRNVNGSVREFFSDCTSYIGIDIEEGPDVDLVLSSYHLDSAFYEDTFDWVVCCEMLEHDDKPWVTLAQMAAVAKDNATLILTCRGYDQTGCFPLHDFPHDVWRFSTRGIQVLMEHTGWHPEIVASDPQYPGVLSLATLVPKPQK